ncbi:MBL fold metallo-hydrolase [Halorarum salinum]|uniref:MBL fold metallo-hydrolase n=1 Tax=Halorarum salinum TaxID=2743089 RepID=A0A7D5L889_9EURY|nr:MBL fold metallo-hydrolase [Halobaculum salinum]QLG60314.1 MBL fold metallo-hydrolase [Halobaculum salinum]
MLPDNVYSYDLLRPKYNESLPQTNEPVSVHVVDDEQTVLFGTGFKSGFDHLTSELDKFGGPDVLVVEHADPDHYDALPALVEEYPEAKVAIPELDVEEMQDAVGVDVDIPLTHDEVRWGIRTIHVPGHTPGNMSFLHEATDTLIVGDTFVHKNSFAAASGEWPGTFAPVKASLNADDEETKANMDILLDYDFDAAFLTHGLNVPEHSKPEVKTLVDGLNV